MQVTSKYLNELRRLYYFAAERSVDNPKHGRIADALAILLKRRAA